MAAQKCAKALRATCHEGSYSYGLRKTRLHLLRRREQLLVDLRAAESGPALRLRTSCPKTERAEGVQ
jgi:hypothetical protein